MKADKKIIIFFGGSFNPPLISHFSLAQQIINEYEQIEKIVFVPVNSQYEKTDLQSNEHRYNMLKLVTDKNDAFETSRIELDAGRPLYTIESLRIMQKQYKDYEIWFTMGTDNLRTLHTWEKALELVNEFKILVLERGDDKVNDIINENTFLQQHKDSFIVVEESIRSNMSSTFVRKKLQNRKNIRYLTPDEIYFYIQKEELFK